MAQEGGESQNSFTIQISADRMLATVSFQSADTGEELTDAELAAELNSAIVGAGIDPKKCKIETTLKALGVDKELKQHILLRGQPAVAGEPARYEYLVSMDSNKGPTIGDDGVADHHQINEYLVVDPGTPLLKRIPATEGRAGVDVLGNVICANLGSDPGFPNCVSGVHLNPEDDNVLIASIKGHPILCKTGIQVDPTLKVKDVNLKSGDIDFDGSLIVEGDVYANMTIKVTGDIHVKGMINNAVLIAGNDIIATGIAGKELPGAVGEKARKKYTASLEAGGSIQALYANVAKLVARENIAVKNYLFHCSVRAGGELLLGQDGGQGLFVGGAVLCGAGVKANVLGNDANVVTRVHVGQPGGLQDRYRKKKAEIHTREKEAEELDLILAQFIQRANGTKLGSVTLNKAKKIGNTIEFLNQTVAKLKIELEDLDNLLEEQDSLAIVAAKHVYPNVSLSISGVTKKVEKSSGASQFFIKGDAIEHGAP